jgi:hypothetical protein
MNEREQKGKSGRGIALGCERVFSVCSREITCEI